MVEAILLPENLMFSRDCEVGVERYVDKTECRVEMAECHVDEGGMLCR